MILQRWECGCIGFRESHGWNIIIMPCDSFYDAPTYSFMERGKLRGEPEDLDQEASDYYVGQLQQAIIDGHRYQEIRRLLNVPDHGGKE